VGEVPLGEVCAPVRIRARPTEFGGGRVSVSPQGVGLGVTGAVLGVPPHEQGKSVLGEPLLVQGPRDYLGLFPGVREDAGAEAPWGSAPAPERRHGVEPVSVGEHPTGVPRFTDPERCVEHVTPANGALHELLEPFAHPGLGVEQGHGRRVLERVEFPALTQAGGVASERFHGFEGHVLADPRPGL